MDNAPYKKILDEFIENGEAALDNLLEEDSIENYYFDFKESTSSESKLSPSDKRNFAKALSGFSNTSGGLLIWGVRETDKKFSKFPVSNPTRLATLLNATVSQLTQPTLSGVNSIVVKGRDGNSGFVVTEIPKYYFTPVQVISDADDGSLKHRYYVRSGSGFVSANHDILTGLYNRQRSSRVAVWWKINPTDSYQENDKIIAYRFQPVLQNKGVGIIRDLWVNCAWGGLEVTLEKTAQSDIFPGWNIHGLAINLVARDDYKCAPQQTAHPFLISVVIKKEQIPLESWLYLSFGADQVAPVEIEIRLTQEELIKFILSDKRDAESFLKFFGLRNFGI